MKYKITQLGLITSLLIAVLFTACKKEDPDDDDGGGHNNQKSVNIENFAFSPSQLTIAKDVTVVWTNNDSAPHTVTADDDSFTSPTLNQGDTYSRKFTSAGTVAYHCEIHPSMKASVVVQ